MWGGCPTPGRDSPARRPVAPGEEARRGASPEHAGSEFHGEDLGLGPQSHELGPRGSGRGWGPRGVDRQAEATLQVGLAGFTGGWCWALGTTRVWPEDGCGRQNDGPKDAHVLISRTCGASCYMAEGVRVVRAWCGAGPCSGGAGSGGRGQSRGCGGLRKRGSLLLTAGRGLGPSATGACAPPTPE